MKERLQKYMALCGVASRRKSEDIIAQGRVMVNGELVKSVVMVDAENDIIEVDGKRIELEDEKVYIMLNKPDGVVTTSKDQFNRKGVTDIVNISKRIYPVGRLDYETTGLLILTNDGEMAFKMTHPSHEIKKVYAAELKEIPNEEEIERFKNGLVIDDSLTAPADFEVIHLDNMRNKCTAKISIHEGKNRQVRKMCSEIGHPVLSLERIAVGDLALGDLEVGKWRYLTEGEVKYVKSI